MILTDPTDCVSCHHDIRIWCRSQGETSLLSFSQTSFLNDDIDDDDDDDDLTHEGGGVLILMITDGDLGTCLL